MCLLSIGSTTTSRPQPEERVHCLETMKARSPRKIIKRVCPFENLIMVGEELDPSITENGPITTCHEQRNHITFRSSESSGVKPAKGSERS